MTAVVVLGGCAEAVPLSEVPIDGGTPEQRALVAEELRAFERWVGEGRVELRGIEVSTLDRNFGTYYPSSKRITLDPMLQGADLRRVARHELCHALDYQEGHLDQEVTAFHNLFDRIESAGGFDGAANSDRFRRSEVLAETCELGPSVALLLQPCPTDPEGLVPIAQFLVDEVWTGDVDLLADPVEIGTVAERVGPFSPEDLLFVGSTDGESARVGLVGQGVVDDRWIDLSTGDEIQVEVPSYDQTGRYDVAPDAPLPVGVRAPPAVPAIMPLHTVVQGDRALVVVSPAVSSIGLELGPMAPRAIVLVGDQWRPVEACPGDVATVFTTPDQLWLAWAEDTLVQWAPVDP